MAIMLLFAQSASEMYDRANTLVEKRDLPAARAAIDQALRVDPRLVPALTLRAKLAMANDELDEAERSLKKAIEIAPTQSSIRTLLGIVSYLKNDFDSALDMLALSDQSDARAALYQAMSAEALNRLEASTAFYERALKLDRSTAEPRVAYARLLLKGGALDRAQALIEEALKLEPRSADALYEEGRCLFERADYTAAAEFGERALAFSARGPLERRVRYLLIRAYQKQGKVELAERNRDAFDKLPMPMVR